MRLISPSNQCDKLPGGRPRRWRRAAVATWIAQSIRRASLRRRSKPPICRSSCPRAVTVPRRFTTSRWRERRTILSQVRLSSLARADETDDDTNHAYRRAPRDRGCGRIRAGDDRARRAAAGAAPGGARGDRGRCATSPRDECARAAHPWTIGVVVEHPDFSVVVCLGTPRALDRRPTMVGRLNLPIDRFATLVHPTAVLPASVAVGVGTVVHAFTVATADVVIGDHVQIMPSCVITHDDRIEDFATLGAGARLAGAVTVGRGAYVGSGALIREGVTIGDRGARWHGRVVVRDVPSGETWAGVPARPLDRGASVRSPKAER